MWMGDRETVGGREEGGVRREGGHISKRCCGGHEHYQLGLALDTDLDEAQLTQAASLNIIIYYFNDPIDILIFGSRSLARLFLLFNLA